MSDSCGRQSEARRISEMYTYSESEDDEMEPPQDSSSDSVIR